MWCLPRSLRRLKLVPRQLFKPTALALHMECSTHVNQGLVFLELERRRWPMPYFGLRVGAPRCLLAKRNNACLYTVFALLGIANSLLDADIAGLLTGPAGGKWRHRV